MQNNNYPFAVRLIGFSEHERDLFDAYFALEHEEGHAYFCLSPDSLQDPDLYIADGDDLKALTLLTEAKPSPVRPALLIGNPPVSLPYPTVPRPIEWDLLFDELEKLIEKRADTLSRLPSAAVVKVPERRRRQRVDFDLTDPADYEKMRKAPPRGGVLLVDKNGAFSAQLGNLLAQFNLSVDWVDTEDAAVSLCSRLPVSAVLINTSVPSIDPYSICTEIKKLDKATKTAVILLVAKNFPYNSERARAAGSDGILEKPISVSHLLAALKKFMNLTR